MKGVLGWVKSNLLIVIPLVLAILAAPVAIYFSSGWNAKIRKQVTDDVNAAQRDLEATVTYEIPSSTPGMQPVSVRAVPNATANQRGKALLEQVVAASGEALGYIVDHNRAGKESQEQMLIGGSGSADRLFPAAPTETDRVRLLEKLTKSRPDIYAAMLQRFGAGAPPNPDFVLARLKALRDEEVERILSTRVEQKLTAEEEAQVRQRLSAKRVELYQNAARDISFYATPEVFVPGVKWESRDWPSLEQAWDWQQMFWIHNDLLAAIEKANSNSVTKVRLKVEDAPVKRIEEIRIEPIFGVETPRGGGPDRGEPQPTGGTVSEDLTQAIQPDYTLRHTGRAAWPQSPNGFFDIREAEVTLIADATLLPTIVDAINSTNFMTVVGMSFGEHSAHADLSRGYYYGPADLVRVRMRVETVWLRSWVKQYMPPTVREQLGIPADPEPAPDTPAEA